MAEILFVEDDPNARKILSASLTMQGHAVTACGSVKEAEQALSERRFDVVLTDLRMDGRDAGLEVLERARSLQPEARCLLLTAYASAETAVAAMKQGAFDYLTKPVSSEELADAVERALADAAASAKAGRSPASQPVAVDEDGEELVGVSAAMRRVRERLARAAATDFTVLIIGESGTGKELAARMIHRRSARASGPFVPVHCGAIPEGLFEAELFGHSKGAFTGAEYARTGLIEAADGGTLFLDEVGEMPLSMQVKLLRALQERSIRRVGEDEERPVDVRVIAATNRDLETEVRAGRFREDLFFRLNVIPVHLPPLRSRREDIPVLAEHLVRKWSEGRARLTPEALERLARLPLMGNVRELENLLQRMLALSDDGTLDADLLDEVLPESLPAVSGGPTLEDCARYPDGLDGVLAEVERRLVEDAIAASGGVLKRAAERLGISFRSLRYRLDKLKGRGSR